MFKSKLLSLPRAAMIGSLVMVLLVGVWSCGKDKKITGPDDPVVTDDPKDTTPPSVAAIDPSANAVGVRINSAITVTFSEVIDVSTITTSAFKLDHNVTGAVTVDDNKKAVKFVPANNLAHSTTYTGTVTAAIKDMAGNAMRSDYTWKFTTEEPPEPAMNFPLTAGKRWLYSAERKNGYVSAQGISRREFAGDYVLYVNNAQVSWQGRNAAQLVLLEIGGNGDFEASYIYLSQGPNGVERWKYPNWKRLLSTQGSSFSNSIFLFARGPENAATNTLSSAQITVPAGSFRAVKSEHHYKLTGQYALHDIFEDQSEYYANGVGLVAAYWDWWDDDNDPMRADYYDKGKALLKYVDSGPFPEMVKEIEPNHSAFSPTLQAVKLSNIAAGNAALNDAGQICNFPEVHATKNGAKLIHDWYRLTVTATTTVTFNLAFDGYNYNNDLDMYLFKDVNYPNPSRSRIDFVARSTEEPGKPEKITKTLTPGVYILGIQAWDTPGGRTDYWLRVR